MSKALIVSSLLLGFGVIFSNQSLADGYSELSRLNAFEMNSVAYKSFADYRHYNYYPRPNYKVTPVRSYQKKRHKRYKSKRHSRKYRHGFPKKRKATGRRVFIFSPRKKMWAAYDANGRLVRTGRASGGKHYCADVKRACRTPRGVFRIRRKGSPHCRSSKYPLGKGGAPMPYCMFFSKYYAIHGSPNVPRYNASHGCIRVLPSAARWLSRHFIRIGTTVIVRSY